MLVFFLRCSVEFFSFVFVVCDIHIFESSIFFLLFNLSEIVLDFSLKFSKLRLVAGLSPDSLFHFYDFKTNTVLPMLEEFSHLFIFVKNWSG